MLLDMLGPAGDTTKLSDPYFPFEDAVDVWGRWGRPALRSLHVPWLCCCCPTRLHVC